MLKTENGGSNLNKVLTVATDISFFSGTQYCPVNIFPIAAPSYMGWRFLLHWLKL
jgi:hypothetical protein